MALNNLKALWKESVSFFAYDSIRLFFLSVLNNCYRTLVIGGSYFWWLLLIVLGARVIHAEWLESVALLVFYFFLVLIARPSVERKDMTYFMQYLYRFPGYIALCFLLFALWHMMGICFAVVCSTGTPSEVPCSSAMLFLSVLLPRLAMLALLFFIDLPNTARSILTAISNSILFYWYFLPVMIVFLCAEIALLSLPQIFGFFITWQLTNSAFFDVLLVFLVGGVRLFALSIMTQYYVKMRYQHLKLFFS